MAAQFEKVIVVLGAPNDAEGRLSALALERVERAWEEFQAHPDHGVLTTGGWGAHFNTTALPHGAYSRRWLEAKGVPGDRFLSVAESGNTPEDAAKARPILLACGARALRVVTSDFHVPRARFCFERECPGHELVFCPAVTRAPEDVLQQYRDHEAKALARLRG